MSAQPAPPCTLVIFGITGDLTKRLLFPSICNLGAAGLLDKNFSLIGLGSSTFTTSDTFREDFSKELKQFVADPAAQKYGQNLLQSFHFIPGDFNNRNTFLALNKIIFTFL